jgi:hypothetical protein
MVIDRLLSKNILFNNCGFLEQILGRLALLHPRVSADGVV